MGRTLIIKRDVHTTIAILTLSLSNSNAVSSGFRVTNVTRNIQSIRPKFGRSAKAIRLPCCAAIADISYQLQNISDASRFARSAAADLIPGALFTTIFTLKVGFEPDAIRNFSWQKMFLV